MNVMKSPVLRLVLLSVLAASALAANSIPRSVSARYGRPAREVDVLQTTGFAEEVHPDESRPNGNILDFGAPERAKPGRSIIEIQEGTPLIRAIRNIAETSGLGYSPSPKIKDTLVEIARIPEDTPLRMINALVEPYGYRALVRNSTVEVFGGPLDDGMVPAVLTYKLKHVRFGSIADSPRSNSMVDSASAGASGGANGGGGGATNGRSVLDAQDLGAKEVNEFFTKIGSVVLSRKAFASLVYDPRSRTIVAKDLPPYLEMLRQYLDEFDCPQRKVIVHMRLVNVSHSPVRNRGINYDGVLNEVRIVVGQYNADADAVSSAAGSVLSSISPVILPGFNSPGRANLALGISELNATLNLLQKFADVELVQETFLMAQDGQSVHKFVGEKLFIVVPGTQAGGAGTASPPLMSQPLVGDSITFRPEIGEDGEITASFKVESSQESRKAIYGGQAYPQFAVNDTQQFLTARDRQTVMLSGFLKDQLSNERSGIPILGDLPVVGSRLFGSSQASRTRSVTLLLMTMQVIEPGDSDALDRARDATVRYMKKDAGEITKSVRPDSPRPLTDLSEAPSTPPERSRAGEKAVTTPLPGADVNAVPSNSSSVPISASRVEAMETNLWLLRPTPRG